MHTRHLPPPPTVHGYALVFVLLFTAISMLILGGTLGWTSTSYNLTERNNQYFNCLAAAEAASEKILANMERDYQTDGERTVTNNLTIYRAMIPTAAEDPDWANYLFSDGQGSLGKTFMNGLNRWSYQQLNSQFQGLYGSACLYQIVSNARLQRSPLNNIVAAVEQDVQLASIPVFQFAIFYSVDLEINPGANMNVTGRVHSNADLFTEPQGSVSLQFQGDVTSVGQIYAHKKTGDPNNRGSSYNVTYNAEHQSKVSSLTLPIGTNNSPDAVYEILKQPPTDEDANSLMGKQRYYNKADLIVLVSNDCVRVSGGLSTSLSTTIPSSQWTNFVNTNISFFNQREGVNIKTTQVDVSKLAQWNTTNTILADASGNKVNVRSLFVADYRTNPTGVSEPGVRLVNGQTLPSAGFTVATPDPLYVQGNYNAPSAFLGTTNTTTTVGASLVCDAITILSSSWNDSNSSRDISYRSAGDTTVNAAIISGNVPTSTAGSGNYSGGVENFPRFLENWSGHTLTYNGSMVVMFFSKIATAVWGGANVYSPPARNWAFDLNFMNATKLPPGTPEMRALVRNSWTAIAPNTVPAS
jgi:hypothetical protein